MKLATLCRAVAVTICLFAGGLPSGAYARDASPEDLAVAGPLGDMTLGNKDAPVTVYEYASFTCPHCADFSADVFPNLKRDYIDTGKVFFVFRPFGFHNDPLGMAAAMISLCAGPKHHLDFASMFFKTRRQWVALKPMEGKEAMKKLVEEKGISGDQVDSCLANQQVFQHSLFTEQRGAKEFSVRKTPTIFVNGERFSGSLSYDELREEIDKRIAQ